MKRFIAILMVLLMIPLYCFAANSPTIYNTVSCHPKMMFFFADQTVGWQDVLPRLQEFENKDYILLEALTLYVDKKYKNVEWELAIPIKERHEPIVYLISEEEVRQLEVQITDEGTLITNFTDVIPGIYYICFYVKGV